MKVVRRVVLAVVMLAGGPVVPPPSEAARDSLVEDSSGAALEVPSPSKRISLPPPPPMAPPSLPAGADTIPPLTLSQVTSWPNDSGPSKETRQKVLRTSERILVVPEGGRQEWLFVRNAVDPRRMAGYLVDHSRKRITVHDEGDLSQRLQLRGWADVLMMRFDPGGLAAMEATGERQSAAGASFDRYVQAAGGTQAGGAPDVTEVFWSETLLLPLRLTVRSPGGETTSLIETFEPSVDAARLADPRLRWSGYETIDAPDAADRASHHH